MTAGGDKTPKSQNHTARTYFDHSSAQRVNTDAVIVDSLRSEYPSLHLTVVPQRSCDLISYASSGNAGLASIDNEKDRLRWNAYIPPATRLDNGEGAIAETVKFGKFLLDWEGKEFVVLVVEGRDGTQPYPNQVNQYVLSASIDATDRLLLAAGKWSNDLHGEIWVFDGGYWQKSAELWESVSKSSWDDVILDDSMKEAIRSDVDHFFSSRETYANLKVPWKRGIIYWGPPGNGKTISIKATMHTLYERKDPIPTLYVRSLSSFAGPEYSINQIFSLARRTAPCYLVFEDLDTIVSDNVRSYFLNEVDGIKRNDGILMLGSTNHLDRLDPGISKRPSRFDRKYLFPNPDEPQRVQYAHYWQKKLESNKGIEFPDALCEGIASITDGFSFAYIQEAMVASLLAIAAGGDKGKADQLVGGVGRLGLGGGEHKDLDKLVLWREIKKQVKILRDEMGDEEEQSAKAAEGSTEQGMKSSKDDTSNERVRVAIAAGEGSNITAGQPAACDDPEQLTAEESMDLQREIHKMREQFLWRIRKSRAKQNREIPVWLQESGW
jgi:transitional endoplasmic reticulum ATPase